jgi:integrase
MAALQTDGKRTTVYGKTRQEVSTKLAELKRQADQAGGLPDPGRRTVGDLLDAWLRAKAPGWKPRTQADYTTICDSYLRPELGALRVGKLTPERIQRLVNGYQVAGQHRTALKAYRALSQALALAVRWNWVGHNPAERVDPPKYQAKRKDLWSPAELAAFIEGTAGHWLGAYYLVALSTGARPGELLALTWADVDTDAGALTIERAAQRIGGERVTTAPKTRAGTRTITLPAEGLAALRRQAAWQAERRLLLGERWTAGDLVFSGYRGAPLTLSAIEWALRGACERLGLPPVTPHGLRHLHASLLLAEGLSVPAVSKRLGHAHAGVTMAVYAHAIGQGDGGAADAIGRALDGGKAKGR